MPQNHLSQEYDYNSLIKIRGTKDLIIKQNEKTISISSG